MQSIKHFLIVILLIGFVAGYLVATFVFINALKKISTQWSALCKSINKDWADYCNRLNKDWADYCKGLNKDWADFCHKLNDD